MELASKQTKLTKLNIKRPYIWLIFIVLAVGMAGWFGYRWLTPVQMGQPTVGFTPLTELGSNTYHGAQGGLYPGGNNERPFAHEMAGVEIAKGIRPLASDGSVNEENGKIGFVAVGMSNTSMEFGAFLDQADDIPQLNPAVVLVDGAQHSKASQSMSNPFDEYWSVLGERLAEAELSDEQVQVVWLKNARARTNAPFPVDALLLKKDLRDIVKLLHDRFPNLKIIYLSSRTYGGYANIDLNPEPYAYQSAFSVKWLIEDQLEGNADLNFDSNSGSVSSPWLSWGPYLWTDGTANEGNGFVWKQSDFSYDGTHTSPSGQAKVAGLLYYFLRTDETAVPWFLNSN